MTVTPRLIETLPLFATTQWHQSHKCDPAALRLFARHYSADARRYHRWQRAGFVGPGEAMVLMTWRKDALFVWLRQQYRNDDQAGVECSVFRNESAVLSSTLIAQAMGLANRRWPDATRYFTFVDPTQVQSRNPGYCFKRAGWTSAGRSSDRNLHILEYQKVNQ